jgi:RHS repeat-associated protein
VRTIQGSQNWLTWVLTDNLNSTTVTANADGSFNSEMRYSAFGEIRYSSGTTPTNYQYTGQLSQPELGLDYYVARWYDPYITQFSQPDTVIPDPVNPSDLNRYSYVRYNPIGASDPSGHKACDGPNLGGACDTLPPDPSAPPDSPSDPVPDVVDPSALTPSGNASYGGKDAYDLYLKLFNDKTGWWWSNNHFTLEDFFTLIFYREGGAQLASEGNTVMNGYTFIDALGEGASRAYYGWCLGEGSNLCGVPGTVESFLNWSVQYSGSLTNTLTAIQNGFRGSDLHSQFSQWSTDQSGKTHYSAENAAKVANAFFNADDLWKVQARQSAGRPYGWGNDTKDWLLGHKNDKSMVIWSFDNFFIPSYEGWQDYGNY